MQKELNDERSVARDDDSSNEAGYQNSYSIIAFSKVSPSEIPEKEGATMTNKKIGFI
mgnify:CR=1 FL=1